MYKLLHRSVSFAISLAMIMMPLFTVSSSAATVYGPNLLSNASVEAGKNNKPSSWVNTGFGSNTRTFTWESAGAQEGDRSLKTTVTNYKNGDANWYFNAVNVSPNTTYEFRDYYKASVSSYLTAAVRLSNNSVTYINLKTLPASADWQIAQGVFTTPGNARTVTVYHSITSNGFLQTDNFFLGTVTNTSDPEPEPEPDPTPPTVSLTTPSEGSTVNGVVVVSASADDVTEVAGVQFKLNGSNLGAEDTSAPYSVNWDTNVINDGEYTLTAVARNTKGLSAESAPVAVTVKNYVPTPPNVIVTAPGSSTPVAGLIMLSAEAGDAMSVTGVQFKVDGQNVGEEDVVAPYSVPFDTTLITDGSHTVTAVARNSLGLTSESDPVTFLVNNAPASVPVVAVTAPAAYSMVSGTTTMTASASDENGITSLQFKVNGQNFGSALTETPFSLSWDTIALADGTYTITAEARNAAGLTSESDPATVTVYNPVAPTVSMTSPQASSIISGVVTVTAVAEGKSGIASVQFKLDDVLLATDTTAPYEYSWDTSTASNGVHSLSVTATNNDGLQAESSAVSVTVDNVSEETPPEEPPVSAGWPTAQNTGPLVQPTNVYNNEFGSDYGTTSYRITQAGAVIDGYVINKCLYVTVPNVIVRNSIIKCGGGGISTVWFSGTTGAVIEHNEIIGTNNTNPSGSGVTCSNCRVHRNRISNTADGIKPGDNAVVTENYIGQLAGGVTNSGPTHNDGIQIEGSSTANVLIRGNTIDHNCQAQNGGACNSAIWMQNGASGVTIDGNYFRQWKAYFIIRGNGSSVNGIRVIGNLFQKDLVSGTPIAFTNGATATEISCNRYSDGTSTGSNNSMAGCVPL